MGTRSITHIHEMQGLSNERIVCTFYRHFDGYPTGHGKDLAQWLAKKRLVNGIGSDFVEGRDFNRAGTMAVNLMSFIQDKSGCEVIPTGSEGHGEEFVYNVYFREGKFFISTNDHSMVAADQYDGERIEAEIYDE